MSGESRKSSNGRLALAIGQGVSIAAWPRANQVPVPTAFRWARDPVVRKAVESCRHRTIDQAIGRMTKHSIWAADGMAAIARDAESDSVRLRAFRALFSDMIAVSNHSGLEGCMAEIEEKILKRDGAAASTIASRSPANYGQSATPAATLPLTSIATSAG